MRQIKILKEKQNPLFKRKEIEIVVEKDITPKISEAEEFLSKKFSSPIENIKIKKILGKFGSHEFSIIANIYSTKQDKERIEPKEKKKKVETQTQEPTPPTTDSSLNKETSSSQ